MEFDNIQYQYDENDTYYINICSDGGGIIIWLRR